MPDLVAHVQRHLLEGATLGAVRAYLEREFAEHTVLEGWIATPRGYAFVLRDRTGQLAHRVVPGEAVVRAGQPAAVNDFIRDTRLADRLRQRGPAQLLLVESDVPVPAAAAASPLDRAS